jgi:hypothetical protein
VLETDPVAKVRVVGLRHKRLHLRDNSFVLPLLAEGREVRANAHLRSAVLSRGCDTHCVAEETTVTPRFDNKGCCGVGRRDEPAVDVLGRLVRRCGPNGVDYVEPAVVGESIGLVPARVNARQRDCVRERVCVSEWVKVCPRKYEYMGLVK